MKVSEYTYPSHSGLCEIKAWGCSPDDGNVRAVLQIHHGMAEHSERYKDTVKALTDAGYAVFMHDMMNHGQSNENEAQLGYFGDRNGYISLVEDVKTLFSIAKNKYNDKKFIIIGHSMGSFVMRLFAAKYGNNIDGAIFIGTSGPNPLTGVSVVLTEIIGGIKGQDYKSSFIKKAGFGSYNKRFENRTDNDWLTRDTKCVDAYNADKRCGYVFSVAGYRDLAKLVSLSNSDAWYASVRKDLPILILSGALDPVGEYSKGVKKMYEKLISTGHSSVTIKLYPDCRHEVLNELSKEDVYKDIDIFITGSCI